MTKPKSTAAADVAACVHRWVLGTAREGATQGTCRLCQAVRTFTDGQRTWPNAGKGLPRRGPRPRELEQGRKPAPRGGIG